MTKQEAWVRFAAEAKSGQTQARDAARWAVVYADSLAEEMEKREREGRFGTPVAECEHEQKLEEYQWAHSVEQDARKAAESRADKAVVELNAAATRTADLSVRLTRAESLLKEVLKIMRKAMKLHQHQDGSLLGIILMPKEDHAKMHDLLSRARQEGYSDGE